VIRAIAALLIASAPSFAAILPVQAKGGRNSTACDSNGTGVSGPPYQLTCSFATLPTVGNTVIVSAETYNTTMTAADNQSNSYSTANHIQSDDTHRHAYLFYAPVTTSSGTFTVTVEVAANSFIIVHIYEFSGLNNASLLDQTSTGKSDSGTATVTSGSVTTTQADELIFMIVGGDSTATPTAGTGFTLGETTSNAAQTVITLNDQYKIVSSIQSSQTYSMDFSPTTAGYAFVVGTFKAAAGGGGSPNSIRRRPIAE
jgi:hypothetical protein